MTVTHPRACLSMLSAWNWSIDETLDFFDREGVRCIGAAFAKLEASRDPIENAAKIRARGYRVANLIGLGRFELSRPETWDKQRQRMQLALDAAETLAAECLILTTGPARQLTWEDAADRYADAMGPVLPDAVRRGIRIALEHTVSLRADVGFVHTLHDTIDLARRLGIGVCMEIQACWDERGLADTITNGIDTITIMQVSDYRLETHNAPNRVVPGDGDIPIERIVGQVLAAGYPGVFDLELLGPEIEREGYESACTRSLAYLSDLLKRLGA